MANQHTTSNSLKPTVRAVLLGLTIILLFGKLDSPAAQLINFLCVATREALVLLPSFVLAAWQAFQQDASEHHPFSICGLQMLVFWPLLQGMAKSA
jgi:hypothetical protein